MPRTVHVTMASRKRQTSRRERQILDVIYTRGAATAKEIAAALPNPPTRTAVRTFLRILEEKGWIKHRKKGREFVYQPVESRRRAGKSAMRRVVDTFFDGSLEQAVASHLADRKRRIDSEELDRLAKLIEQARMKGE